MSVTDWRMKGPSFNNCSCDPGCPCQFNSLPTHGDCKAVTAMRIDEGHFGDVPLDGLYWASVYAWPAAVHLGNGTQLPIIDERADDAQRHALAQILRGEASEEGSTYLWVFASTMSKILDPVYKPIEFDIDIEKRTARIHVPGIVETAGKPIRNPITGEEHRALIHLPNGFEYTEAEIGCGDSTVSGDIRFQVENGHAHMAVYHLTHAGVVRT